MRLEESTRVLINLELEKLEELTAEISAKYEIELLKPASTSLVMMGSRDSVQLLPFYLGEVLISQCTVEVNENIGYGYIMGEELEKVYHLAAIDAVWQREAELTAKIKDKLLETKEKLAKQEKKDYAILSKTKVNFESMEEMSDGIEN